MSALCSELRAIIHGPTVEQIVDKASAMIGKTLDGHAIIGKPRILPYAENEPRATQVRPA